MNKRDIVIVGAGHGGAQAATMLRQLGFGGSMTIVGDELEPPYERPPLSKAYLSGEKSFEQLVMRPPVYWQERSIELSLGRRVVTADPVAHSVTFSDGATLSYGTLIWSAGGTPRRLTCNGHDLRGVHTIRKHADILSILESLPEVNRTVVVGGGYIGLEAAAVLTQLGKEVVLVESGERVLGRVAGKELSRFYEAEHRSRGVRILTGATVEAIVGVGGKATGVLLADHGIIPADMVIVGIGIVPETQALIEAGAAGTNGVLVDELCRTTLPDIYAIGDCAAHSNRFAGGAVIRLESVQNANDQAATVAKAITGTPEPYAATPWFWSDQYDLKLQTVGFSIGHDRAVLRGAPEGRSFSVVYLKDDRVIALDCVNNVRDYSHGRRLVETAAIVGECPIADATWPLRNLLKA